MKKNQPADIEKLLEEGNVIQIKPQGWSMYPLFVDGRDSAIIESADGRELKRGDVVLYRREKSILVLHRIWKCRPEGFYMVGDNQAEIEGPLHREQIKGIMTGMIRKGKNISLRNPGYVVYAKLWLWLRPCRPWMSKIVHVCKGGFNGIKGIRKK